MQTALETGLPTNRLIFEFTENERLDTDHVRNIVRAYRALGFATAIDDFGAGHAGIGLLAELETDALKLDMSLVRRIDRCSRRQAIVKGMVELARDLDMLLTAEGVETLAELHALQRLGVRYVQGFLLARPMVGTLPPIDPGILRQCAAA